MIKIEPTAFRVTLKNGTVEEWTLEEAQDACAALMAMLPSPHDDCHCSEETPADTNPPTLKGFEGPVLPPAEPAP